MVKPLSQPTLNYRSSVAWFGVLLALAVISFLYLYKLDRPLLWADEAQTGIAARNILRFGYPTAYDGRNVAICADGRMLDTHFLYKQIPWINFYLGAASLAIFGNTTAGLRILFALVGALAFFPIFAVLKSRLRYPAFIALVILISPQALMFQRNARYYPPLILLYAILLWHFSTEFKSRTTQFVTAMLIFILLFHTHCVAALCCSLALILVCLLVQRKKALLYLLSSGVGFLSWFVWYRTLGPSLGVVVLPLSLIADHFRYWLKVFLTGFSAAFMDLDAINCLPILLGAVFCAILLFRKRETLLNVFKDPVVLFILASILTQAAAVAAVLGFETVDRYSILRYMPHLIVAAGIPCFMVIDRCIPSRPLYLAACIFVPAFNLLSLSFWERSSSRSVPVSWVPPVYSEILKPREDAWDAALALLRDETSGSGDRDSVIFVLPPWTQEVVIFYLGDRCIVPPFFSPDAVESRQRLRRGVGDQAYSRLTAKPEWVLDILGDLETTPPGYTVADVIPSHRARPDDGTRPELIRHTFLQPVVVRNIKLYRLQKE